MKKDIIKLKVKTDEKNRLDLHLAKNLENLSRSQIKKIIISGHLKINDETIKEPSKKVIKIVDVLGRETPLKPNTPLLYIYNDGSVERKMIIKQQ